ncbi:MAG: glycoside hydrolase family 28 protein [Bryobacteraceae bacterium]|jgi:polygalacturonase
MKFGARADGRTNDAEAIQKAIDACAQSGGGVVYLPAGNFLSGTIVLKSNITLRLSPGATLWGSRTMADYSPPHLIYAKEARNVAIEGGGVINGNGEAFWDEQMRPTKPRPVPLIYFFRCRDVRVQDVNIRNAPGPTLTPRECDTVKIRGVSIVNNLRGWNTDGIIPDSSRNVQISDCYIEAGDDCIVIKATNRESPGGKAPPSENITVSNCILTTTCNNLKLGTETLGDFKNIAFTNCTIFRHPASSRPAFSGVAIEMVDGSTLDGVVVSNITMRDVGTPIFIRLGNRGRGMKVPVPGVLQNVSISNIVATGSIIASSITGLLGHPVRNVSLSDINILMYGGEREVRGLDVPELPSQYPEAKMFGILPSYGLYGRHVEGLTLRNVRLGWFQEDVRPAMILDDARDVDLDGFKTSTVAGNQPVVWLNDVVRASVRGCLTAAPVEQLVRTTGKTSAISRQ